MKRTLLMMVLAACGVVPHGENDSGVKFDAGVVDAGGVDAGEVADAGLPDAGEADAGIVDAGVVDAGPPGCPVPTGGVPFNLRVMAANLTSGDFSSYDPGNGARIMAGAQPDIVMIQEFNYGGRSDDDTNAFVVNTFGPDFSWFRGTGNIPNGILSRYPILESGEWDGLAPDRELVWARIDLPGGDLLVISVHLLTASAGDRNADAMTIMSQLDAGTSPFAYVLVGGDFNTNTRNEAVFTTFAPRFKVTAPYPLDQNNNGNTTRDRSKPYDHVLASNCLAALQVPTVIGANQFDGGLVIDTREYTPIGDLAPAESGDSDAGSMQHMGVVKDFLIRP
jgi:endonuclease/exonuclease/phosphatase family metal-dependent hydrolase